MEAIKVKVVQIARIRDEGGVPEDRAILRCDELPELRAYVVGLDLVNGAEYQISRVSLFPPTPQA